MKSKKPKTRAPRGLSPKTFRRPLRWAVDQDYEHALSPEEKQYLSDFNDAYYAGDFTGTKGEGWSPEDKRQVYLRSEHANNDVLGLAYLFGTMDSLDDHEPPAPADAETEEPVDLSYLEHPKYKAALQAWRRAVDETPSPVPSPSGSRVKVRTPSNEARRLKAELDGIIRLGRAGLL